MLKYERQIIRAFICEKWGEVKDKYFTINNKTANPENLDSI